MLAGNPPFLGASARAILARESLDPVPRLRTVRETVPEEFERAVVKALARAPADRFATASQFAEALVTGSPAPGASRRPLLIRVALPLLAALTALGAIVLARRFSLPGNPAALDANVVAVAPRSEEHTSELQSRLHLVCRLLLEKKNKRVSRI